MFWTHWACLKLCLNLTIKSFMDEQSKCRKPGWFMNYTPFSCLHSLLPPLSPPSRHYVRTKKGALENTPYVDLSYKWTGGGYLSNAEDLVKFGNAVLTCLQLGESTMR